MRVELTFALVVGSLSTACAPPRTPEAETTPLGAARATEAPRAPDEQGRTSQEPDEVGLASWYGKALAGRRTASGEPFDPSVFTAAHKKLPFGTWVEVRRSDTGRSVRVRINDRGPNGRAAHRIIDLSERAARELDMVRAGVVRVELRVVRAP